MIVEKDRILTENANKTYHYGRIQAESFTPYPKNPIIANFFNNIGRADKLGSGVRNLYKYTKMYANSEPVLFEDDVFKVKVPLSYIGSNDAIPINADKREEMIISYILNHGSISNKEASAAIGTTVCDKSSYDSYKVVFRRAEEEMYKTKAEMKAFIGYAR